MKKLFLFAIAHIIFSVPEPMWLNKSGNRKDLLRMHPFFGFSSSLHCRQDNAFEYDVLAQDEDKQRGNGRHHESGHRDPRRVIP